MHSTNEKLNFYADINFDHLHKLAHYLLNHNCNFEKGKFR